MKQSLQSQEVSNDHLLSGKQIAGIAVATIAVGVAAGYAAQQYVAHNMDPGSHISDDLGITHNSAAFSQDLDNGVVAIEVPAIDVAHSHGDK